jgi:hypothetical protein
MVIRSVDAAADDRRADSPAPIMAEPAAALDQGSVASIAPDRVRQPPSVRSEASIDRRDDLPTAITQQQMAALGKVRDAALALDNPSTRIAADVKEAKAFHAALREALQDGTSSAARDLSEAEISRIRKIETYIADAESAQQTLTDFKTALEIPDADGGYSVRRLLRQSGEWLSDAAGSGQLTAIGLALTAMTLKNGAWYLPQLALSSESVSLDDTGEMTKLVALRSLLGTVAAATLEYIPAAYSQSLWNGSPSAWVGMAQVFDMATSAAMLTVLGAKNNQTPSGVHLGGLAISAAAGVVQSGMLSGVGTSLRAKFMGSEQPPGFKPFPQFPQEMPDAPDALDDSGLAAQDPEALDRKPKGAQARQEAKQLQILRKDYSDAKLAHMRKRMDNSIHCVGDFSATVQQYLQTFPVPETADEAGTSPLPTIAETRSKLQKTMQDMHLTLTELHKNMEEIIRKSPDEDGLGAATTGLEKLLQQLGKSKARLDKDGGMAPEAKVFFAATSLVFAVGSAVGAFLPALHSEKFQQSANKAVILGATSSIAQAFANLGQFLGGANLDDPRCVRWLKMGVDNGKHEKLKAWARAVRFLPFEFVPLQWSRTLSEQAERTAGAMQLAPGAVFPDGANIRVIQEGVRSLMSVLFSVYGLGNKAKASDLIGTGMNVVATAAITVASRRQHKT